MKITLDAQTPEQIDADTLVVFAWQTEKGSDFLVSPDLESLDVQTGGLLLQTLLSEKFSAGTGKTFVYYTQGKIPSGKIIVAGMGKQHAITAASVLMSAASVSRRLKDGKTIRAAVVLADAFSRVLGEELFLQTIVEGLLLGAYEFTRHKTVDLESIHAVSECVLLLRKKITPVLETAKNQGEQIAEGVMFTRNLVNESPSTTTPSYLGNVAEEIAKTCEHITAEVFGKDELKTMGMGGILAIARGSEQEPKFIKLEYHGGGKKTIALIGKGITFDTGGLSLKPANSMETMKMDMAGAATVLGIFSVLSQLHPAINVVGLISATENMPGPNAVKPGDIVKAKSGKTIEILNTDAEGRVVLADALSYAVSEVRPDVMIDLATLTGACIVALGEEICGMFANDQTLAGALLNAATHTGESMWQLPLVDEYRDQIKSKIADIKNIGAGKWGGALTAALFLQEFTSSEIPWAHMDIAGPAFAEKDSAVSPYGGTGYGVRLLLRYLLSQ